MIGPGSRVEQWKEAGRQEERERQRTALRDLIQTIPELAEEIRAAERARIREELLVEVTKAGAIFAQDVFPAGAVGYIENAINRICKEPA